ncbi:MAG: hypothetical protein IKC56_02055, partial [Clostridia bacterium]|nr:hypothetical protein [Clostridia bacterium]
FAVPIAEKKILEAKKARYALLTANGAVESIAASTERATDSESVTASTESATAETEDSSQKGKNRERWIHPALSYGLLGSFALLVLLVGLYFLLF